MKKSILIAVCVAALSTLTVAGASAKAGDPMNANARMDHRMGHDRMMMRHHGMMHHRMMRHRMMRRHMMR